MEKPVRMKPVRRPVDPAMERAERLQMERSKDFARDSVTSWRDSIAPHAKETPDSERIRTEVRHHRKAG